MDEAGYSQVCGFLLQAAAIRDHAVSLDQQSDEARIVVLGQPDDAFVVQDVVQVNLLDPLLRDRMIDEDHRDAGRERPNLLQEEPKLFALQKLGAVNRDYAVPLRHASG